MYRLMVYLDEFNTVNKMEFSVSPTIFIFSPDRCLFLPHVSLVLLVPSDESFACLSGY